MRMARVGARTSPKQRFAVRQIDYRSIEVRDQRNGVVEPLAEGGPLDTNCGIAERTLVANRGYFDGARSLVQ